MKNNIKVPRIVKINWIRNLTISVNFEDSESRVIEFSFLFKQINLESNPSLKILFNKDEFSKVILDSNTLSWNNVEQYITLKNGERKKVPFEIGADVLLKFSTPDYSNVINKYGQMVREARLKSGLTQKDLAIKSGISRNYISRIENNRTDLEISKLMKIVENGLGKKLEINIL